MRSWMYHLSKSPFCYKTYPIIMDAKGRDACPCGWVDAPRYREGWSIPHTPLVGSEEAPGVFSESTNTIYKAPAVDASATISESLGRRV